MIPTEFLETITLSQAKVNMIPLDMRQTHEEEAVAVRVHHVLQ